MPLTNFTWPLTVRTSRDGVKATPNDVGSIVAVRSAQIAQNSTNVVSATISVPAGARILQIMVDVATAFNSATTAVLTIGTAAAGTQYVTSVDAKTGGRAAISHTAAQVTSMFNVGTNTSVVATLTPTGATSAGLLYVTVLYTDPTVS